MARVLNEFQPNTKAIAREVNENFEWVQEDINDMGNALQQAFNKSLTELSASVNSNLDNLGSTKLNIDMSNAQYPYIKESYRNGSSWYVIFSNNFCIQGGIANGTGSNPNGNGNANITFLVEFADTNYLMETTCQAVSNDSYRMGVWVYLSKSTGFVKGNTRHVNEGGSASYKLNIDWVAFGIAKEK